MSGDGIQQCELSGECGLLSVINAIDLLYPCRLHRPLREALYAALVDAVPGDYRALVKDGCERDVLELLLDAACAWVLEQGWPSLMWEARHPKPGVPADEFWSRLGVQLGLCRCAAIIGFGEDSKDPNSRYEPHWTCVETIKPKIIDLRDSTRSYGTVRRRDTAIAPERGWMITDAFLLRRDI